MMRQRTVPLRPKDSGRSKDSNSGNFHVDHRVDDVKSRLQFLYETVFRRTFPKLLWFLLKIVGYILLFLYVFVPVFVKFNPWILQKVTFSTFIRWPPFIDLTKPRDFGLVGARHFYLSSEEDIKLGVWHVLPESIGINAQNLQDADFDQYLNRGKPVVLYLHGNSGTRGGWHRVQIYKLFSSLDFNVVTLDYRGFGDSTGEPTEEGVVADAYALYKWIKARSGSTPVFLWGHSMGTGVTAKLAKYLCEKNDKPVGVVLESPFNNIREAAYNHPYSKLYKFLPWFQWVFIEPISESSIFFNSDESIQSVTVPLMILHAEDDAIVPYHLGRKLYHVASTKRPKNYADVEFISYDGSLRYGHKHIFQDPGLPDIIRKFLKRCYDWQKKESMSG